jgi:hypothetical protein
MNRKAHMGTFEDSLGNVKITILDRLDWLRKDLRGFMRGIKWGVGNLKEWLPFIWSLRPWDADTTIIDLMIKQLRIFVRYNREHGHATDEHRIKVISSAREAIKLLTRLRDPMAYDMYALRQVDKRFPQWQSFIQHCKTGTSYGGRFLAQADGWVGMQAGKDAKRGFFKILGGELWLRESPDQQETDRILKLMEQYEVARNKASERAKILRAKDTVRLIEIFEIHFHTWWD